MFNFTFTNPWFLIGLLAAVIPLALHLLGRRKLPRYEFSSLRLVLASQDISQRRSRITQWLLLLIRTAIIILFVLAMANPVPVAKLAAATSNIEGGRNVVIIVDNSLSMSYRTAGHTLFDSAKQQLTGLLEGFGDNDRISILVTAGEPVALLVSERASQVSVSDINTRLRLHPDVHFELTFDEALSLLSTNDKENNHLVFISDFRAVDYESLRTSEKLREMEATLKNVSTETANNISIQNLTVAPQTSVTGLWFTSSATIYNGFPEERTVEVILKEDDANVATPKVTIPAYSSRNILTKHSIDTAGPHWISASISGDRLPADDARFVGCRVREKQPVWLLYNRYEQAVENAVQTALMPFDEEQPGSVNRFVVASVHEARFFREMGEKTLQEVFKSSSTTTNQDRPPVLIIIGIERPDAKLRKILEDHLSSGGGIFIIPSRNIDTDSYNRELSGQKWRNDGILPAKFGAFETIDYATSGLKPLFSASHELTTALQMFLPYLSEIEWHNFFRLTLDPAIPHGNMIASLSNQDAFLVEKPWGKGHVLTIAGPLHDEATHFYRTPGFLPFIQAVVLYLSGLNQTIPPDVVTLRDLIHLTGSPEKLRVINGELENPPFLGEITTADGETAFIGLNCDPNESRLDPLAPDKVTEIFGAVSGYEHMGVSIVPLSLIAAWKVFLMMTGCLLILELIIANSFFGYLAQMFKKQTNTKHEINSL